jgi:hypothetical protein
MKANSLVPKLRIFTRESEVRGERPAKNYLKSRFEIPSLSRQRRWKSIRDLILLVLVNCGANYWHDHVIQNPES